ncbi:MAG TPA: hypothetical protein VGM90_25330 [Kofleriaceae bacterium]|jgi:hypothetical protein
MSETQQHPDDCICGEVVAAATSGWADEHVKMRATLAWLDQDTNTQLLTDAIAKHVYESDPIMNDNIRGWLIEYPLDATALAVITDLSVANEYSTDLIPQFDGYPDPLPISTWADLARLPSIEVLALNADDALPAAADVMAHPRLRQLDVPLLFNGEPRYDQIAALAMESGFFPTSRNGDRVTLVRGAPVLPTTVLLLRLADFLPRMGLEEGKEYALVLVGATLVDGALRASLRLNVTLPDGEVGDDQHGELVLLPANGTEEMLEDVAGKLDAHITEHRTLPTSL